MRALALALALALTACATARPQTGAEVGAAVRAGRLDMATYDFARTGFWSMTPEQRHAWSAGFEHAAHPNGASNACTPEEVRVASAGAWLILAEQAGDEAMWRTQADGLRQALGVLDARIAAARADNPDPRLRELFQRVSRDQTARGAVAESVPPLPQHLPPFMWNMISAGRMIAIDCDNTAWMRAQLAEIGWFDARIYGAPADGSAWLLVQHADRDPDFQRQVLARLEALPDGATSKSNLALLTDRVAGADHRPQRFGTQGACQPDGTWAPHPVENPDGLDERRAAVGLPPEAAYIAMIAGMHLCPVGQTPPH
ncbi:MAG: DUF6624 domain-containing protein [Pseudomonadota bacterium]